MARARSNCFCASGEHEVLKSTRPSFSCPPLREAGVVSAQLDTTRNSETTAATTVTESFIAASFCCVIELRILAIDAVARLSVPRHRSAIRESPPECRVTGSQASIYLSGGRGSSRNMPLQRRPQQQWPRCYNLGVPQSLPNRGDPSEYLSQHRAGSQRQGVGSSLAGWLSLPAPGWLSMGDSAWLMMGDPGWLSLPAPVAHHRATADIRVCYSVRVEERAVSRGGVASRGRGLRSTR